MCRLWKEGRKGPREDPESLAWLNECTPPPHMPPPLPVLLCPGHLVLVGPLLGPRSPSFWFPKARE